MTQFINEIFSNINSAEQAYQAAINIGYHPKEINLVMSEETHDKYHSQANTISIENTSTTKDVIKDSAVGATIGGSFGILTAIATSVMAPGLGVIIVGPILAGLASAAAGALGGGLIGLLSHAGITEEAAKKYEEEIKNGGVMIAVDAKSKDADKLQIKWQSIKHQTLKNNHK